MTQQQKISTANKLPTKKLYTKTSSLKNNTIIETEE